MLTDVLTHHAARRLRQRALTPADVFLALAYGIELEQNGATVLHLTRRALPVGLPREVAERAEGTAVVVARDGSILTAFRRRRLPRSLRRRRPRRRRS